MQKLTRKLKKQFCIQSSSPAIESVAVAVCFVQNEKYACIMCTWLIIFFGSSLLLLFIVGIIRINIILTKCWKTKSTTKNYYKKSEKTGHNFISEISDSEENSSHLRNAVVCSLAAASAVTYIKNETRRTKRKKHIYIYKV